MNIARISLSFLFLSGPLAACAAPTGLLPHSLYFIDGLGQAAQVWRLERDGITNAQITAEETGVDAFAVSPVDGSLAFITHNQLFLMDFDSRERQLVAENKDVAEGDPDYIFRAILENPVFSPDGRTLAYALDGLHLHHLDRGSDEHVLTNLGNLLGEPFVFAQETYSPGPWSPDGSQLLIIMAYYEGSTLAVMEPEAEVEFRRLWSEGPVCCQFSWTPDSGTVLVANPYFSVDLPGLWKYETDAGVGIELVAGLGEDGSLNYAGWPHQLAGGDYLFFFANQEFFSPEAGIPLVMVQSDPDGSNLELIRPEQFQIAEVLWAADGSLAVISGRTGEEGRQVFLARTDGSPLQVLIEAGNQISGLAWGP